MTAPLKSKKAPKIALELNSGNGYFVVKVDPVKYATQIAELVNEHFKETSPTAFIGAEWWIAFSDQAPGEPLTQIAGLAGGMHSVNEAGAFYLNRGLVVDKFRGNGIQLSLIKARLQYAKQKRFKSAVSDTWNSHASTNNLIRAGFMAYNPENPWRSPDVVYWKKLI